jgi:SpoVK/Ycf46/Vps4 family AAA+-type ATPase
MNEKASIIRTSGLLEYIEPPEGGLSIVGGYDALKEHVLLDKPCFTNGAREFGIEFPRGIMAVGVSGCGKTLVSLAIASELNLPLVSLDVGSIMGSLVGESEKNMREAIRMIERISPCVLQADEIDKSFGGSGDRDGGTSKRIFASFLKWMSARESAVYIVATANDVSSLPIEFLRSGRFDSIFGFDLPDEDERRQIFDIHISKRGRDSESFNTEKLSQKAMGFVGADIEQAVKNGLKIAFSKSQQLKQSHIEQAIKGIVPLSKVEPEKIKAIQEWCQKHTKMANPTKKTSSFKTDKRKIELN